MHRTETVKAITKAKSALKSPVEFADMEDYPRPQVNTAMTTVSGVPRSASMIDEGGSAALTISPMKRG